MEAERRVIGALLLQPSLVPDTLNTLSSTDFYVKPYGWVFNAIADLAMADDPVSVETVARRLGEMRVAGNRKPIDEMGGTARIAETLEGVMPDELEFWTGRVKQKSRERTALDVVTRARQRILDGTDEMSSVLYDLEGGLVSLASGSRTGIAGASADQAMDEAWERVERYMDDPDAVAGLPTGWYFFDRLVDGFRPGNLYIFYGRTSQFKSWFTTQAFFRVTRQQIPGYWFTTEMPRGEVMERLLQTEAGVNLRWVRREGTIGQYRQRLERAASHIRQYPLTICDRSLDINTLKAEVMRRKKWGEIEYVLIDLVNQVSTNEYKDDSIAKQNVIMAALKDLAKDAMVPIAVVAHTNKGDKNSYRDTSLALEDMKGSSSLYQDVDLAVSLVPVRQSYETGDWEGMTRDEMGMAASRGGGGQVILNAAITKNRQGELGSVKFLIDFNQGGRITEFEKPTWVQKPMADMDAAG
jgi:replicative DNA helicase